METYTVVQIKTISVLADDMEDACDRISDGMGSVDDTDYMHLDEYNAITVIYNNHLSALFDAVREEVKKEQENRELK